MRLSSLALRITFGLGLITAIAALAQQRPAAQVATKPPAQPAAQATGDAASHQAMIDQYCIMCHSDALKTAGVVLEGVPVSHVGDNTELWERVLRKFGTGQMPPPGMPRPDTATAAQFT